jgi:hypothetical protein
LSAAAKILSMYRFSDRYKRRVGSYKRKKLFLFRFVESGGCA